MGKSEWGAQEVTHFVLGTHPHQQIKPPIECWVCSPSFDVQKDTTQKKLLFYLPPDQIASIDYLRTDIAKEIRLKNGSLISFKSYEQGREKFQGAGKRLIWFDEEPPQAIYDECFVRQEAGSTLDIIMSMTPIKGMTWVFTRLYQDSNNPDLFISTAGWDDNPYLTDHQKAQMERGLTDEALQVRKYGKFVKRVGLVCNWWDRDKNLAEYQNLPHDWTYFESLDYGFSDPAAYLLIGVDADNSVHVIDGFREPHLGDAQIVAKRQTKITGLQIRHGYIDYPDQAITRNLASLGMPLTQVEKTASNWDELLAEKLAKYGKVERGTGKPRLFISRKLDWLIQEIENLTWLEIRKYQDGETQVVPKWDDHRRYGHHFDGIRALSYFLASYTKPYKPLLPAKSTKSWAIGRRK